MTALPPEEPQPDPGLSPEAPPPPPRAPRLSELLTAMAEDESRERVSLGDMMQDLGARAFGPLLVLFALLNLIPSPPGTSAILGMPLLFLTFQMVVGSAPWFPGFIAKRSLRRIDLQRVTARAVPYLAKAERLLKPRLAFFSSRRSEQVLGLVLLGLATILVLPIPFGNTAPSIAIAIIALGLIERDGFWIIAGLIAGAFACFLVYGVIWTMVQAAILLVTSFFA